MKKKDIPDVVISRLPRYYRFFRYQRGRREKISSRELARELNTSASQVRLDLSYFGGFGLQGYGYNIEDLFEKIGTILGVDHEQYYVIIGAGSLGHAIARFPVFQEVGFRLVGIFDIDPEVIGRTIGGVEVFDVDRLATFLSERPDCIAILATPSEAAVSVSKTLYQCGVSAILNFAPVDLPHSDKIPVRNIHLLDKLLELSFRRKNH